MERAAERFLQLISYNTQSKPEADCFPSTREQLIFGDFLVGECKKLGFKDADCDSFGYVTATLPANTREETPVIGLLAHMDTSPDFPGAPIRPRLIENYDGNPISLSDTLTLSPSEFSRLKELSGHNLIVTDGTTLLGADDKAGIAEILTAMEYLLAHPEIPHGQVRIAFTPDEEVGHGADHFDVTAFGADYAYTVDGSGLGELEYENFNAARAKISITGKSVHPGYAKDIMINAALIAQEMIGRFPVGETPAHSAGREGFYHLTQLNGNVEHAQFSYIIRDFDKENFERRKRFVHDLTKEMKSKYGESRIELSICDEYYNMLDILANREEVIKRAKDAMEQAGIRPIIKGIRGGTDGSRLSFMGLPCPNIFTGGYNFHGPYEFVSINEMADAVRVIVNICSIR